MDVTRELLMEYSPYLGGITFDFTSSTLEFTALDSPESPARALKLVFSRVRPLEIAVVEFDEEMIDAIVGIDRNDDGFVFQTEKFSIKFRCDSFRSFPASWSG